MIKKTLVIAGAAIALFLAWGGPNAHAAALILDATSSKGISAGTTVTSTITVGTGTNQCLIIAEGGSNTSSTGMTVNGVSATLALQHTGNAKDAEIWFYMNAPTGTVTVSTTIGVSTNFGMAITSLFNCNYDQPLEVTTSTNATTVNHPSSTLTTVAPGDWIFDATAYAGTLTVSSRDAGMNALATDLGSGSSHFSSSYATTTAATTTFRSGYALSGSGAFSEVQVAVMPSLTPPASWNALIDVFMYPGAPACSSTAEYTDGRVINGLFPQYHIMSATGSLILMTTSTYGCNGYDPANVASVKQYSQYQYDTIAANASTAIAMFSSGTQVAAMTSTEVTFLVNNGLTGAYLDFEGFGKYVTSTYAQYLTFLTNFGAALHAAGKKLIVAGPAIGATSTYPDLSQNQYQFKYEDMNVNAGVDQVSPLAYDDDYTTGVGNPTAPIGWVNTIAAWVTSKMSSLSKVAFGMPNYAYHGTTGGTDRGGFDTRTQTQAVSGYSSASRDSDYEMVFNSGTQTYVYQDQYSIIQQRLNIEAQSMPEVAVFVLGGNPWFPTSTFQPSQSSGPASSDMAISSCTLGGGVTLQ